MQLIINDESALRKNCDVINLADGRDLARRLASWVERNNKKAYRPLPASELKSDSQGRVHRNLNRPQVAIGIAAPQLGIYKRVALVSIKGRLLPLINPRIVSASNVFIPWTEMCLSFPGKEIDTYRRAWVEVQCDNWPAIERIGPKNAVNWNESVESALSLRDSVCVQHEIAHLYGKLMFDFQTPESDCPTRWGS